MKKFYYWPNLKKEVAKFVSRCFDCQQIKAECKHLGGLLQPILIPEWKWEVISMDFITSFPRTSRKHDSIMVVVDKFTKVTHFIPVKYTYSIICRFGYRFGLHHNLSPVDRWKNREG